MPLLPGHGALGFTHYCGQTERQLWNAHPRCTPLQNSQTGMNQHRRLVAKAPTPASTPRLWASGVTTTLTLLECNSSCRPAASASPQENTAALPSLRLNGIQDLTTTTEGWRTNTNSPPRQLLEVCGDAGGTELAKLCQSGNGRLRRCKHGMFKEGKRKGERSFGRFLCSFSPFYIEPNQR